MFDEVDAFEEPPREDREQRSVADSAKVDVEEFQGLL